MHKFLLAVISTLLIGSQVAAAQGVVSRLRTTWSWLQGMQQAQKLVMAEIDLLSARSLRKISIVLEGKVVTPERFGRAVPPLTQAMVLLHEREALLAALKKDHYSHQYVRNALRKIVKLGGDGAIVVQRDDGTTVQHPLDISNLKNALDIYTENVDYLADDESFILAYNTDQIFLLQTGRKLAEEFGTGVESFLERIDSRKKRGRRDLARALHELGKEGNDPFPTALVNTLAREVGFATKIEAFAKPIVDEWEDSYLPGIETKAMIYEFAARIAATRSDRESLDANLQRILALNNDIDRVQMTVSLRGEKIILHQKTIDDVYQLYWQIFSPANK